jgi:nicotinamidase-related amidase
VSSSPTKSKSPYDVTALLVIDVQIGLVTGAYRELEVLQAINTVMDRMRAGQGRIVFIQHCHATYKPLMPDSPGWALHPSLDTGEGDLFIRKTASDAFYETTLDTMLRDQGINHLVVTGLQTEYCVDTTCRSALNKNYDVTLVSDAHTTGNAHIPAAEIIAHHNAVLANLAHPHNSIDVRSSDTF